LEHFWIDRFFENSHQRALIILFVILKLQGSVIQNYDRPYTRLIWHFFLRSFFGHFLTSGGFIPANIMFRPVKIDLERDMVSIEKNLNFFFVAHMWHNIWPAKWNSRFFAKFWCFGKFSLCAWCVRINMRKCWQKLLQYVYFSWQYGYAFIFCDNLYPEL